MYAQTGFMHHALAKRGQEDLNNIQSCIKRAYKAAGLNGEKEKEKEREIERERERERGRGRGRDGERERGREGERERGREGERERGRERERVVKHRVCFPCNVRRVQKEDLNLTPNKFNSSFYTVDPLSSLPCQLITYHCTSFPHRTALPAKTLSLYLIIIFLLLLFFCR